jgi:DNA-binding LytR/AlgR family response regulator
MSERLLSPCASVQRVSPISVLCQHDNSSLLASVFHLVQSGIPEAITQAVSAAHPSTDVLHHFHDVLIASAEALGESEFVRFMNECRMEGATLVLTVKSMEELHSVLRYSPFAVLPELHIQESIAELIEPLLNCLQQRRLLRSADEYSRTQSADRSAYRHARTKQLLTLQTLQGERRVAPADVVLCIAEGENTSVILGSTAEQEPCTTEALGVYQRLQEIEETLYNLACGQDFMRVHRSFIVNVHSVREATRADKDLDIRLEGYTERIRCARTKKDDFLRRVETACREAGSSWEKSGSSWKRS